MRKKNTHGCDALGALLCKTQVANATINEDVELVSAPTHIAHTTHGHRCRLRR